MTHRCHVTGLIAALQKSGIRQAFALRLMRAALHQFEVEVAKWARHDEILVSGNLSGQISLEESYWLAMNKVAALIELINANSQMRWNALLTSLLLSFTIFGSPLSAEPAPASASSGTEKWSSFFDTDLRFSSWRGDRGTNVFSATPGKGTQYYAPISFGTTYQKSGTIRLDFRGKTGYVWSNHATSGQEANVEHFIDTQLSTKATFLNFETFRPYVGLAVNLPTGLTYLPGNQRFARMDPDLVEVGSYGAGYNYNPTIGLTFALNQSTDIAFGGGYAWRGTFEREAYNSTTGTYDARVKIDPGDVFTVNASVASEVGAWDIYSSFAFMSETDIKRDGIPVGRKGAKYIADVDVIYQFNDRWALNLNGSWSFLEKDKVQGTSGALITEPKNSNSHLLIGSIEPNYLIAPKTKIGLNYSVLYRINNYYDQIEEQFVPSKLKQSVGGSVFYSPSATTILKLRVSHFWVHEYDGPLLPTVQVFNSGTLVSQTLGTAPPNMSFTGWAGALTGSIRF